MPIRDIVIIAVIGVGTAVALGRPWLGCLTWNWISFMNPHRLGWFIRDWPVAQGVAATTLIGLALTQERRAPPLRTETVLLFLLLVYFGLTTAFAWDPLGSSEQLIKVAKIYLFVFVTLMLFYERERIRWLMLITIASVGFFGVKGGIFSILTGGQYRVWGPPGSFIADNTALGLALSMILPMAFYAARAEANRWIRWGLWAVFWLSIPAIMFTYSRGALLGLVAALFVVLWRYSKAATLVALVAAALFFQYGLGLLPEEWVGRQETTANYQEDHSAMQRIQAWQVAFNVALERPLRGAGFNLGGAPDERWLAYADFLGPWYNQARAAHSIWFQVLGQHGFLALALFIGMLAATWFRLGWLSRHAVTGETAWIGEYARGMQLALVPYAVSGTFLSLAYFDLVYSCVVFAAILDRVYAESSLSAEVAPEAATTGASGDEAQGVRAS